MHQQKHKQSREADFTQTFLSGPKYHLSSEFQANMSGNNPNQQHEGSAMSYLSADQGHMHIHNASQQCDYFNDQQHPYMAGGDGNGNLQALTAKYSTENKDARAKRSHLRKERNRSAGETFGESSPSSARSDSTRRTAIEQSKKGRQLLKLTHSRANLMKTVDEGMKGATQERGCCNKIQSASHGQQTLPKDIDNYGSEDSNPSSSPSALVINEKIINPMIRKFRLLYLHNIREEVSIMEDLEMLPRKLDEVCRKMDKD